MKKVLLLVFACAGITCGTSAQNCTSPAGTVAFQSAFNQIAIQQTNQRKLDKAIELLKNNCLMSVQVKNIALLFTEESFRFEFCKAAWQNTFDRPNFYEVYDAFSTFSYALKLHDEIYVVNTPVREHKNPPVIQPVPPVQVAAAQAEPVFPNYAYPSCSNYNGKRGCTGPALAENMFKQTAQNVFIQPTDESKQVAIQNASDMYCLEFGQVMKLVSLVQSQAIRMRLMMSTFSRVYDLEQYQSGIVLFNSTAAQNDWMIYARNYLIPAIPPCTVSNDEFSSLLQSVKAKSFSQDKMNALDLVSKNRCFSVAQISIFGKDFSFGSEKVTVFKKLYATCVEKNLYYKLVDDLSFSSEQEDLSNFIKRDGK